MPTETLITVDHISRYFGDHCAVSNISFTLQRGEVLGFLGPNGAGKTTTMNILCGVLAASSGKVSIAGYDSVEAHSQAKMHIGYLPERPPLYLDQTVDEYLLFCGRLRRISKAKLSGALLNSKQRCGLQDVGNRLIANLSKGYQQRIGIAQAIIHSPSLVVLDEPTVGLDPIQIVEIRELISELGEDHSVILSTHILPEAQSVCDRVLIIHEGKLVLDEHLNALHKNKQHKSFSIALNKPPVPEELLAMEGVMSVINLDRHRFRINHQPDKNLAATVAEKAVQAGWELYELIPESNTLEDTFVQLTSGDIGNEQVDNKDI